MDRETAELIGPSEEEILEGDVWGEIELFNKHVMASDRIKGELFGIVAALYDEGAAGETEQAILLERFQGLLKSGKISEHQVQLVTQACRQFFFLGWHSRGAVEDAEKMKGF